MRGALVNLRKQFTWRISAPSPTKLMNYFSSPEQTRTFSAPLLCASWKEEKKKNESIPNGVLYLPGFQLFRVDHTAESLGKTRGGRLCFYVNKDWCTDITTLKMICCPNLEVLFIKHKAFLFAARVFLLFSSQCLHRSSSLHECRATKAGWSNFRHNTRTHYYSLGLNLTRELPKYG